MSEEDREMLVSAVKEFCQKNVESASLRIERSGIDRDLVKKLGSQGFIALTVPEELGGSGIDRVTYTLMLKEFARFSPSVAMMLALDNSIIFPLLSETEFGKGLMKEASSGEKTLGVAIPFRYVEGGTTSLAESKMAGSKNYVFFPGADALLINTDGMSDSILAVTGGFRLENKLPALGFRGLGVGTVSFDSAKFEVLVAEKGKQRMFSLVDAMPDAVSGIALGIAEEAQAKAVEYSKVRGTFGHLLKDYQPVAFPLSLTDGEIRESVEELKQSRSDPARRWLKQKAIETALTVSRQSIQVHGGYGYLEDFGVEKLYRDAMMLYSVFSENPVDRVTLSKDLYQEEAGYL